MTIALGTAHCVAAWLDMARERNQQPDQEIEQALYLSWFDADLPDGFDWHGDAHPLAPGLWLVRSDLSRSKLYHRIKWQLPEAAPLLLAPLDDTRDGWPKFKGLEAGALKWLRGR